MNRKARRSEATMMSKPEEERFQVLANSRYGVLWTSDAMTNKEVEKFLKQCEGTAERVDMRLVVRRVEP